MNALIKFLKGKWLKHPLHPAVAHVPAGLWPGALICDLLSRMHVGGNTMVRLSFYCISAGLLVAGLAVASGLADWSDIKKEKPAWKIGLYHMTLNLIAAAVFAINLGVRIETFRVDDRVSVLATTLSGVGTLLVLISGYLGGLMVYDRGTGVARESKKKLRRIAEAAGSAVPPEKGQ